VASTMTVCCYWSPMNSACTDNSDTVSSGLFTFHSAQTALCHFVVSGPAHPELQLSRFMTGLSRTLRN